MFIYAKSRHGMGICGSWFPSESCQSVFTLVLEEPLLVTRVIYFFAYSNFLFPAKTKSMPSVLFSLPWAVVIFKPDSTTLFMKPFSPMVTLQSTVFWSELIWAEFIPNACLLPITNITSTRNDGKNYSVVKNCIWSKMESSHTDSNFVCFGRKVLEF